MGVSTPYVVNMAGWVPCLVFATWHSMVAALKNGHGDPRYKPLDSITISNVKPK